MRGVVHGSTYPRSPWMVNEGSCTWRYLSPIAGTAMEWDLCSLSRHPGDACSREPFFCLWPAATKFVKFSSLLFSSLFFSFLFFSNNRVGQGGLLSDMNGFTNAVMARVLRGRLTVIDG
ncbi:hypothetical protein SVI_3529 [Shewanella violacea DSS12]|uniref:Uncharacterized protein n=1 Tax=Shewanella violacea (strain JCM 10179 / CIP 106290 / LMG 19151 / DSS12) TaxID=637905 RepID=D4ZBV5_SHEVD|nr:hypothetical protein SVI_3529 [Shewanella violacea DSS12]